MSKSLKLPGPFFFGCVLAVRLYIVVGSETQAKESIQKRLSCNSLWVACNCSSDLANLSYNSKCVVSPG